MKYAQKIVVFIFVVFPVLSYANDIFQDIKDRDIESIQDRISRGEEINQVDKFGLSPLWYAAKYQQIEMVELLLDNGAGVHSRDHKMRATVIDSLHNFISRSGQERLKKIEHAKSNGLSQSLIDNSYPAQTPDGVDFTESGTELWRGILALIESRIEATDSNVESHEELGQPDQIDPDIRAMAEHLDKGYDINIQGADGETMLMRAIEKGSPEMVSYLLSRGIDPELRDNEGRTALEYIDAVSDEGLKEKMTSAFDAIAHKKKEVDHQVSKNVSEISEVIEEVIAPEPVIEEPAEVVVAEPIGEDIEQSSNWWLWLIGAVVVVGGVFVLCSRK